MFRRMTFAALLVISGFAAGLVLSGRLHLTSPSVALPAVQPAEASVVSEPAAPSTPAAAQLAPPMDFSGVATRAVNGVVNISSLQVVRVPNSPFASDPFFRYFFGDDEELFGSRSRRSLSLGSGVIVSPDGYIVTNSHVVGDNVRELTAVLGDKREVRGSVVGTDPATDIAVVKINASGLPVLPWGDSSKLKPGQWVLAIGSPFQLSQTVTLGIVSAVGRTNVGVTDYEDFIQTDAAINPGNSGGALVNSSGELVGINTAIYSQSGGYQGVGFAVPSNLARRIYEELVRYGEVRRGDIGVVEYARLTTQMAQELGLEGDMRGAVISTMYRNSVAYQAGLRPGDVIVSFNGQRVEDPGQVMRMVADAKIGSTAVIGIIRDGRRMDIRVPIVQRTRRPTR